MQGILKRLKRLSAGKKAAHTSPPAKPTTSDHSDHEHAGKVSSFSRPKSEKRSPIGATRDVQKKMKDWTSLPDLVMHKIMDEVDAKTRCSVVCLVCKDWYSAEKNLSPRWISYKVEMPKHMRHLVFFKRLMEAGHLEKLAIVLPNKRTRFLASYLFMIAGSNIKEITLSNLSQHDVVPLLDLLPKLLKIHLVVDGSKEDQSFSNITKKLSELATLAKLTDLSVKSMKEKNTRTLNSSHHRSICDVLESASSLTSLTLLAPRKKEAPLDTLSVLKNLRSLFVNREWITSALNYRRLAVLSSLTRLELWLGNTDNLISVVDIPLLKELKLRMENDAFPKALGQGQNLQLTSLQLGLIKKTQVQHRDQKSMRVFLDSLAKAFPSLRKLCVSDMRLDGLSQNFHSFVPKLTHLSLAGNMFTRLPSSLHQLVHLEELSVRRNPIIFDNQDLAMIAAMPNLKKISVGAPLKSENAHQKFWLHLYSTQIEKLKTAEPRLLLKKSDPYSFDSELADEESSESESEESDSEDDY